MIARAPGHHRHSVLVVDDDAAIGQMIRRILLQDDLDVTIATDALRALSMIEERLPCMLLVDVMMPHMNGFDLCRHLAQNPRTAHTPVALVSAMVEREDVQRGLDAGAVDYIKKPFDHQELRMRVRTQIRLHESIIEQHRLNKHLSVIGAVTQDAIIIIDNAGNISHWNEAAERIFGYTKQEALGRNLHSFLVPTKFRSEHERAFPYFQSSGKGNALGKILELSALRKSGEEFPVELSLAAASLDDQWCAVGIVRDITERKSTELALKRSEAEYRLLFQSSRDALMTISPRTGNFLSCNQAALDLFGVADTEAFAKLGPLVVSPEYQPEGRSSESLFQVMMQTALREGSAKAAWTQRKLNGETFYADVLLTRIDHESEAVIQATIRDVTERVRSEAALQASEARYRASFEDGSVGQALSDVEGRLLEVNPVLASMLGYTPRELVGRRFEDFTVPADIPRSLDAQRTLVAGARVARMEKRYLRRDGSTVWADVNMAALRDVQHNATQFVTHVVDISERKHIESKLLEEEKALRASEHFARSTVDALFAHVAILDEMGAIITVNAAWRSFAQDNPPLSSNVCEGANYLEVCDKARGPDAESAAEFAAGIRAVLNGTRREFALEYPCSSPDEVRWFIGRVTRYPDPKVKRVVVAHENITERKRAEEAAKEGSLFLGTLLNAIPVPIYYKDSRGAYCGINRALSEYLGKPENELVGKTAFDVFPEDLALDFEKRDRELLAQRGVQVFDVKLRDERGNVREAIFHKATFNLPSGEPGGIIGAILDVTDRKRVEVELEHARKLEAVGQLAAGIAHEINTPAQYVGDGVFFLKEVFDALRSLVGKYRLGVEALENAQVAPSLIEDIRNLESEADFEYIEANVPGSFERCLDGIGRISSIVRAMKEFSHPDQREKSTADLNQALQSTIIIARNEYKYFADIQTDFGRLLPVLCHVGDLNQVFLNLIVNAAHAIREVVDKDGARGSIQVKTRQSGDWVCIEISDTGTGIPESIRDRIFEPFFTTKEVGKGSGQGLAIARSIIVDKHGGSLTFTSECGKGTTFTIRLPIDGKGPRSFKESVQ